jgi:hypothetical protein
LQGYAEQEKDCEREQILEQNGRLVQRHVGSTATGIVRQEPGGDHPGADDCTYGDTCADRYTGSDSYADPDAVADRDTTESNADRYRAGRPV